jgi:hypothetical protein
MKKQAFIVMMSAIQDQMAKDSETTATINKLGSSDYKPGITFTTPLVERLIDALIIEFNDTHSCIKYFIYDLQFGKKADYMEVIINSKSYKIFSPGHLYDLLTNEIGQDA